MIENASAPTKRALRACVFALAAMRSAPAFAEEPTMDAEVSTIPLRVPEELVRAVPGGLTAEQVGRRAAETSHTARAAYETLYAAAGRVDAAFAAFLPRITGTARYTRLSDFVPGAPANTVPLFLDNYLLQSNIVIPISDYVTRLSPAYSGAARTEDAARYDAEAERARSRSEGRIAYYTWMRFRGAVVVAVLALNDQRTHLNDARNQFAVRNASRADVLRAETSAVAAELAVAHSMNAARVAEEQMRVAMHAPESERLEPGEAIDGALPPLRGNLPQMVREALASRLDMKSATASVEAARLQAAVAMAGRYPVVSAFGDALYANPNTRFFPSTAKWFPTWDAGVQATWSPSDVLLAHGNTKDAEARAAALDALKDALRDAIRIDVTQSVQGVLEADAAVESTRRQIASAAEAHRVARDLFNNGRGTSTTLRDAETELARARLDGLNARVDARVARVRFEHALGRDAVSANRP